MYFYCFIFREVELVEIKRYRKYFWELYNVIDFLEKIIEFCFVKGLWEMLWG